MSQSGTEASGSSFSSSAGGASSLASDNTDTRALNNLQEGPDGEGAGDDLGTNSKSLQEGLFSTLYTLTKNKTLDTSYRVTALRIVLEFLQFFRIVFNFSFPWAIQRDLWLWKVIEWVLFRGLVVTQGYSMYITVFYIMAAIVMTTMLLTVWVALALKGSDTVNPWLRRLIGLLQLVAFVIFCFAWPVILDYAVFLFDCSWTNIGAGRLATHVYFVEHSCTAMPHLAHMLFAAVVIILMAGMVLLMGMGSCDMNPLNTSHMSSSDAVTSMKMLAFKIIFVMVSTVLDQLGTIQVAFMTVAMWGVVYYMFDGVPYYNKLVNIIWGGLWVGILDVTVIVLVSEVTSKAHQDDPVAHTHFMTNVMLYTIFPAIVLGAGLMWLRLCQLNRLSKSLLNSFGVCKAAVLANTVDEQAKNSLSVVSLMGDLKRVYRFKDVRQIQIACREMRKWDEDGQPESEAVEYGEFVIKCGMARLPNNPSLHVMYASFMIEARKDGQAARTQLQLAQKASPSLLDNYNIFVAQQLAKQLKREGDGLDLLSYVEFQRNYLACVRSHKTALMAQKTFWNSLLRDNISFRDLQANVLSMEAAEQRATTVYRRVMERYPGNGKVMRFLEYVRNEPGAASKFYEAAIKEGTSESLLALTAAEGGAAGLNAAGQIDEKTDGLAVINAQGIIMMVNAAALTMFGYQKGELEGKNVSILMPPPYSTRHDGFLQRYVDSGQPHILNTTRPVVALHKDRSMFPLSLCVARLSGVGSDTLFIGVMRHEPSAGTSDHQVVKFWATAGGMILCADRRMTDALGIQPGDLVGRQFSNLCTDVEGVNKYLATASQAIEGALTDGQPTPVPTFKTKMLHAFMPAVDVELSVQYGGATEAGHECRALIVHAHVLTEATAVMVVDHKGRLLHATAKLATLLGHPVSNLSKMELNALLPQPICQMHGAWFKDPPQRIPATSCRSGAVVHLLAANGIKVPMTLKMSTKEDISTGHLTHVIQVAKATEEQRLDQLRMLLGVNHKGVIVSVNPGVPHSLFGFYGQQLIGKPLSSAIDIFTDWKEGHGEEISLLELLVAQIAATTSDGAAVQYSGACSTWRVGVHRPQVQDQSGLGATASLHGSSLLHALQPHKVQPACMKLEPILQETGDLLVDEAAAEAAPVLQVALHRSDALTTVIDLDKDLKIARADEVAGLMFGVTVKQLAHKSLPKILGLPAELKHFDDLLGKTAKKGAMKTTAAASRSGAIQRVSAKHLGDGQPLEINMQAMSYDQGGRARRVVRLQLVCPISAAMHKLLELKEGRGSANHATSEAEAGDGDGSHKSGSVSSPGGSNKGSGHAGALTAELSGMVEEASEQHHVEHHHGKSDRVGSWVRQASKLEYDDDDGQDEPSSHRRKGQQQHHVGIRLAAGHSMPTGDAVVAVHLHAPGREGKGAHRSPTGKGRFDDADEYGSDDASDDLGKGARASLPDRRTDDAGSNAASSFAGSMADGMSDAGSGIDSTVSAGAMGHDEDLVVDMRRVKRLKKLSRMFSSGIAQAATNQFKHHTLFLLAIILVTHIACFAVVTTQLDARHANAVSVNTIALSMSAASQSILRINFLHKCMLPDFMGYSVCDAASYENYGSKLLSNVVKFRKYHHSLYLGGDGLSPFSDPRLVNHWTYKQLPETAYFRVMGNGLPAFTNSSRTLWEMGNVLISALDDVYYFKTEWGATMDTQPSWQYAYINGPESIFSGYAWSLDTFTDYTWQDLTKLSVVIIILLVIEAVIVQVSCLAYEFYLLQKCNVSHMRMFSVFLSLPSATVRFMVRKPMVVDDSMNDDMDDDDLDLAEGAAGGGNQTSAAAAPADGDAPADKKKSVRLAAEDGDGDPDSKAKEGRTSSKVKATNKITALRKSASTPVGRFAAFRKKAQKQLFGWMDPRFKCNGKRLSPSSRIIWHFMAPLLLWVSAVVVIYGVSYSNLQGLQEPLASLDLAAHVMYRLTRVRLVANMLAFSVTTTDNALYRADLMKELGLLRDEYRTLLYGGPMILQADVSFQPIVPAAVLSDSKLSEIFFKTEQCLRDDQSTCFQPGDKNYQVTHSGLDAQMNRYMDEMETFGNLPDALTQANHTSYVWACEVTAKDTYEGLQKASDLFVDGTLVKLDSVKQLHIILLVVSLCCMALFVLMLYRPYIKALRRDTKAVINMLSQLPAEVDVEGQVKTIVLGITKTDGSKSMEGLTAGPPNMQLQPYGMPGGAAGMKGGWGMSGAAPGGNRGWFGRDSNPAGQQPQQGDPRMYGYGMRNGMGMQNGMGMGYGPGMA